MLVSFSVENFFSYKDKATLNMVANDDEQLRDSHVFTPDLKNNVKSFNLLHSAVIYGPNASGKSYFYRALEAMRWVVHDSSKGFEFLPAIPFMLSEKTEKAPSVFEVVMVIDGVRYQYGFSATMNKIHAEWLLAFPNGKTQTWFERTYNKKTKEYDYTLGDDLKGQKKIWREATNPKALFLSTAVQLNSTQLKPIYDWFSVNIICISADGISPQISLAHCKEYGSEGIINFLKVADFAIEDIKVEKNEISSNSILKSVPKTSEPFLSGDPKKENQLNAKIRHKTEEGKSIYMNLEVESDGTRRMLALSTPFLAILGTGAILVVDELNQRLHPYLMRYLIELFNNSETNPNNAQLIFTTHAVSLLKNDIFRRDQIWFCERDKNQASTLFTLAEFEEGKGYEDFEAYYMTGRYGAVPFIGDTSTLFYKKASE